MDIQTEYLVLLVAGVAVGSVFFPTAYRRWPSVATRYLKPEPWKRELAALVDAWICAILFVLLATLLGAMTALVASPLCLLVRDRVLPGQSLGKILTGLVVIDLEAGAPCGIARSIRRNIFFVVPGFNLVAVIFEARAIRQDPQGMRLGDRFAGTMVIEGKDAKELVKALQERLLGLLARGGVTRRPDSVVNGSSPGSGTDGPPAE